jgi:hypothetical protein
MKIFATTVAVLAGLGLAGPAFATNLTVTDIELPYNDVLSITGPVSGSGYIGEQVLTTNLGTIDAWCIDLFHDDFIGGGQNLPFTTSAALTDGNGHVLTSGVVNAIAGLINYGDSVLNNGGTAPLSANLNDFAASIQLAIWKVEYTDFGYQGNATLSDLVAYDLSVSANLVGGSTGLVSLNGGQGLVTADPVPEPGTLALVGGAMFGLGWVRRKRA